MLEPLEISNIIKSSILNTEPVTVAKLGSVEATALRLFDESGGNMNWDIPAHGRTIREAVSYQTGVFPADNQTLNKWALLYLNSVKDMDYLLEWCPEYGDKYIIDKYCYGTKIFKNWQGTMEPWFMENSWLEALADKNILVISPFKDTILKQAKVFDKIWPVHNIKPKNVQVIRSGFSFEKQNNSNETYFTELERMQQEIFNLDFDVAILGCGSYAIPLMSFIKKIGIPSLHLGGTTQLLFGIKGKRWDNFREYKNAEFYNSPYWTRAEQSDIPKNNILIEQGCYW